MRWKNAAVLALAVMAVGCSSNSKKELPPNELPDIQEEVRLDAQWSRSIGDGQGELYNLLTPAVDGERLYAAAVNGEVVALDRLTVALVVDRSRVALGDEVVARNEVRVGVLGRAAEHHKVVVGRLGLRERAVLFAAEVFLADSGEEPCVSLGGLREERVGSDESREGLLRVNGHEAVLLI